MQKSTKHGSTLLETTTSRTSLVIRRSPSLPRQKVGTIEEPSLNGAFLVNKHDFFATAPPPVRHLEVFEIDYKTAEVYLRWQEPKPPINGELHYYTVNNCDSICKILSYVPPTDYCKLWSKYICAVVKQPGPRFQKITVNERVP